MLAKTLAMKLLEHPDADVMMTDQIDPEDYDYIRVVKYYEDPGRFHLKTAPSVKTGKKKLARVGVVS